VILYSLTIYGPDGALYAPGHAPHPGMFGAAVDP
jgi:hypothetical protein